MQPSTLLAEVLQDLPPTESPSATANQDDSESAMASSESLSSEQTPDVTPSPRPDSPPVTVPPAVESGEAHGQGADVIKPDGNVMRETDTASFGKVDVTLTNVFNTKPSVELGSHEPVHDVIIDAAPEQKVPVGHYSVTDDRPVEEKQMQVPSEHQGASSVDNEPEVMDTSMAADVIQVPDLSVASAEHQAGIQGSQESPMAID